MEPKSLNITYRRPIHTCSPHRTLLLFGDRDSIVVLGGDSGWRPLQWQGRWQSQRRVQQASLKVKWNGVVVVL